MARPSSGRDTPQLFSLSQLLHLAILQGASDIHIEPNRSGARVRFRIHGILYEVQQYSTQHYEQLRNHIKVSSHLDTLQQRVPQDGRLSHEHEAYDIRVSFFPTIYLEKIVLRLLPKDRDLSLSKLGLNTEVVARLQEFAQQEAGLCLITGPTGSGKTTTVYGVLQAINQGERNVVTLEDPIEYTINGITQTPVEESVFPFSQALRSLLRQDPDVIMVGEMRDEQTALIACEAALTGHLVVSSLHTRTVAESIVRLLEMRVPAYVIAASISVIVSQRLYQIPCTECCEERAVVTAFIPGITHELVNRGCASCNYRGAVGRACVAEILVVDDAVRHAITQQTSVDELYHIIQNAQQVTFAQEVGRLLAERKLSVADALRICGTELLQGK